MSLGVFQISSFNSNVPVKLVASVVWQKKPAGVAAPADSLLGGRISSDTDGGGGVLIGIDILSVRLSQTRRNMRLGEICLSLRKKIG